MKSCLIKLAWSTWVRGVSDVDESLVGNNRNTGRSLWHDVDKRRASRERDGGQWTHCA